ncbi:MAG: phosphoethanolamine--lipid A transferase, partial [Rubrivivax sp.]|nr:phosphoethanolamine--lipid A transferase [Rubrivivax sp.]
MSPTADRSARTGGRFTIEATPAQALLLASLFWALAANRLFLGGALQGRSLADPSTWGFVAALIVMLASAQYLLLAPLAWRATVKPLLALLALASAGALHFMQSYGTFLDPTMMRNVLRTDLAEARELLSWSLLATLLLYGVLPLLLLTRLRLRRQPLGRALAWRAGSMLLAAALLAGSLLAVFQPFSSLMRNHRELRYLITPANLLWSTGAVLASQARGAAAPRRAIGLDARPGPLMTQRAATGPQGRQARPLVVVLVVGETARAANWGLSGYTRQTTPVLARLPLLNFAQVTACGTNTETSLPCMFAPVGRRDYDEARIRGSESLLHLLARAGVTVWWRDNQSGCKGVCDGLPYEEVVSANPAGICSQGHCLDEGLLAGLDERLARARGTQLWVLHMLGNHGPSYFRRYPAAFARFGPACEEDDLQRCSREQIVDAYDNALLYTDHVLASLVGKLTAAADRVDSAMLYVSDHGESLGENGLYLHGMPYAIAPDVQTRVPMALWTSSGLPRAAGLDLACLRRRAAE